MRRWRTWLATLALVIGLALPVRAENVVRWATSQDVTTFDPHASDTTGVNQTVRHVYEPLTTDDLIARIEPVLAVSWRLAAPRVWEFELRRGVTFHDGRPFTADDVVFSFARAGEESSAFRERLSTVAKVEAAGPHTVRVTTREPNPMLWDSIRYIRIMSKSWAEEHGTLHPPLPDHRDRAWSHLHANGTGPFALESFEPRKRTVLVRNPGWWGYQANPHGIDRVEQTIVPNSAAGLDLLLASKLDLLQEPPPEQLARIESTPGLRVRKAETDQVQYLAMDQGSPELRTSDVKGRNPLADRRVREAIYRAVNLQAIVQALGGLAVPAGAMLIWPKANGWYDDLDERLPYDPERAQGELLAEAGYPNGFRVAYDCALSREPACRAVAAALHEVGIRIELRVHSISEQDRLIRTKRTDFHQWGYGETFDSVQTLKARYQSRAVYNATGYADPEVDALIEQADTEISSYYRNARIEMVWKRVLPDLVYVPLYRPINAWAMHERLDLPVNFYPQVKLWYGHLRPEP